MKAILGGLAALFALSVATIGAASNARSTAAPTFYLPFQCNQSGWLASTRNDHVPSVYAIDFNKTNDGDDGQPVLASADGVVSVPAYSSSSNPLAIDHDGGGWSSGWATLYLHMERTVANGTTVKRGDIVGYVSNVSAPGGNHLHYEHRLDGQVRPAIFNNWVPGYGAAKKRGLGVQVPTSDNCPAGGGGTSDVFQATGIDGIGWRVSYGGRSEWQQLRNSTTVASTLAIGDFDGDGRQDDVFQASGEPNVGWRVSINGTGGWQKLRESTTTMDTLRVGDFG